MSQRYLLANIFGVHFNTKYYYNTEMEKEIKVPNFENCKVHACFEESQTLKILNYLEVAQKKVTYKGISDQQGRKPKDFPFESVSFLSQKLKHTHMPIIKQGVESLLKGESSSVLVIGNDQGKKQKILIGQSQNTGFLLNFLAQLFQTCYKREIQDKVTIKLSCWQYYEGKISDLLGGTGIKSNLQNFIVKDVIQGQVLVGIPEIIIRNMKSALKIIRLYMKRLQQAREQGQQTQNLVFTIKLEIDNKIDKQGNITQYLLPKYHIVKLAVPYCLKSPSKHSPWFIHLFNFLQSQVLDRSSKADEYQNEDDFSSYLKDTIVLSVSNLHCLTVFSNKMSTNDCLTALKFSSYLQQLKLQTKKNTLNLPQLFNQKVVTESELVQAFVEQRNWMKAVDNWVSSEQNSLSFDFELIAAANRYLMESHNILEYEYANHLTTGCDKLEKYIFNEEIQDYYYAKKILIEPQPQLKTAIARYLQLFNETKQNESRFMKKIGGMIARLRKEAAESRQLKYMINSKLKTKMLYQKLFEIYRTLSTHFLYQKNTQFVSKLRPTKPTQMVAEQPQPKEILNLDQIITKLQQKQKVSGQPPPVPAKYFKKRKEINQTEMMFTNPNVSLCGKRIRS